MVSGARLFLSSLEDQAPGEASLTPEVKETWARAMSEQRAKFLIQLNYQENKHLVEFKINKTQTH